MFRCCYATDLRAKYLLESETLSWTPAYANDTKQMAAVAIIAPTSQILNFLESHLDFLVTARNPLKCKEKLNLLRN